jgi:hypothetical protein
MMEFDKRHPDLNGLKQTNKFDQARNSFPTIADQDNYLAKLSSEAAKATDPAEKAALEEQIKRVENLFDTDVVSALQRRIKEGVRAKAMRDMQGKLRKFGMAVTNPTDSSMTKGLKKLDASEVKKLGLGAGEHYMHPEVLNGLKRVDEIFTNEGMNKFARTLSAISDIWRPLVTYYKPSHYTNNLIGNVINNLAAGVKISDYKAAGKLLTGYRSGKLTEEQMRIMNLAYKHNVVSGGFLFDSKANFEFTDPTKLEKFAKFVADNRAVKGSRVAGEKVDDISRLANFVNGLDKFGSVEKAANQVRTYLFNYNELTNADRAMRVAVPFWNWTKRNIPLQMKLLMENPKFIMNNQRFRDLFNTNQEGADWQKDSGIHVSDNNYAGVPNPSSDLEMLTNPAQFLGSLNPAIKMTAEMALNKKFFTGKPISYGSDSLQAADVPSYLAGNMGIGGNMYDWATGKKGNMESLINLLKPISKINHVGQGGNKDERSGVKGYAA